MDQIKADQAAEIMRIWDLGPQRPEAPTPPVAPEPPAETLKGAKLETAKAEYELAKVQFEDALIDYKADLRTYGAALKAYENWRKTVGGPIQIERNPVVAREALERGQGRYVTHLPKGMKPGRADAEARQQAAVRQAALAADVAKDPHFGEKAHASPAF